MTDSIQPAEDAEYPPEIASLRRLIFEFTDEKDIEARLRQVASAIRDSGRGTDYIPKHFFTDIIEDIYKPVIQSREEAARLKAASDIFGLAHEYANNDKTMIGSENLRNYHYYNAISKVGKFPQR
jgi:hypothetical protein